MTSFFGWSRDNIKYLIKFLTTHNILDIVFRKRNLLSRIRCDFPVPKIDWIRVMSIFQLSDFTKKTTSKCSVDVEQGDGTKTRPSDTGSGGADHRYRRSPGKTGKYPGTLRSPRITMVDLLARDKGKTTKDSGNTKRHRMVGRRST